VGKEENAEEKMVENLKHSASVQWLARMLHISTGAASWVALLLNFGILAALIFWALKKNLPAVFYTRTQTIQRAIEEARKASEEAQHRLAHIEARLAKLDTEVSSMRSAAEHEAVAEEGRVRAAAAEDTRRIVESAEGEIAAAAKQAQRELKAYAVDLAVTLAERRIQVDGATDQALVRRFVSELGNAKAPGANGSGKEKDGQ
jgi:F-type H+-transporting ATPase subunit b